VIIAGWAVLGVFFITQDAAMAMLRGGSFLLDELAFRGTLRVVLWLVLTPFLLYFARGTSVVRAIVLVLAFAALRCVIALPVVALMQARPIGRAELTLQFGSLFHSSATLAALIVFARVLYDGARTVREKERRALTLETQLARTQLEQLRGQLQPHFLFNAINGIAALVHTDPDRADEMLMELAALLRSTLDLGRSDTIPLRRELELVDHYLRIQTMRFHDRLQVRRIIDTTALGCEVPALLLQPLLENSLRHVIAQRPEGGRIAMSARRAAGRLLLRVEDDGPGFDPATAKLGVGISNTIARLEQLYRGDSRIDFAHTGGAFAVTIDIPAKEAA
ncbi:MAG TPA: histidine kinase, partial [Thermoanaerobaculia bacterium]|nr:histidine kinase [Thermoanaerobaculia bacterium]